ncbi:MAG: class I SAM-dependent methyltransferase [Planctomycetes bacterium]|nr:class I SAM-dependent methyltransferase [Planctomycetota bacterium]
MAKKAAENESSGNKGQARLYAMPLAYEVLHWKGTGKEVRGLARIARKFVGGKARPKGVWMEPACGTGRYLRVAAQLGCATKGIGVDLADELMEFGRAAMKGGEKQKVSLLKGDMTKLEKVVKPGSVDFSFNLINTIRHVKNDAAMVSHLKGVKRALKPGGVYVVGLSLSWYGVEVPTEDVWKGSEQGLKVLQTVQYLPATGGSTARSRMEQVLSHLQMTEGRGKDAKTWDVDDRYELLSYNLQEWMRVVEKAGLRVLASVDEEGNEIPPAEPGYSIFVLGLQ